MQRWEEIFKHDLDGNLIWKVQVANNAVNMFLAVTKGSIFVHSVINMSNYISRYDTSGTLIWRKSAGSFVDQLLSDKEGNFYLMGVTGQNSNVVLKYNENAELVWQNVHPEIRSFNGTFYGDSLVLCGGNYKDGKYGSAILIISKETGENVVEHYVHVDPETGYSEHFDQVAVVGKSFYCAGKYIGQRPFLVKLSDARFVGIQETSVSQQRLTVFPNPSSSVFTVKMAEPSAQPVRVRVSNSMGQLVYEETRKGLENEFDVKLRGYASGIYFLELRTAGKSEVQKIILE
jgi:hypothetical protein